MHLFLDFFVQHFERSDVHLDRFLKGLHACFVLGSHVKYKFVHFIQRFFLFFFPRVRSFVSYFSPRRIRIWYAKPAAYCFDIFCQSLRSYSLWYRLKVVALVCETNSTVRRTFCRCCGNIFKWFSFNLNEDVISASLCSSISFSDGSAVIILPL